MLSSYRVIDCTDERGQLAGLVLAQLGADVILVEPPGGSSARWCPPFAGDRRDADSSLWHWAYNRGKRSVIADLTTDAGRARLDDLVADGDVLLWAGRPGEMPFSYDDLAAVNPGLVVVVLSPFGLDGPKANWAGTDLIVSAAGCGVSLVGDADRPPLRWGSPQAFLHGAADMAVAALVALTERRRSGRGQLVDVSAQVSCLQSSFCYALNDAWSWPLMRRSGDGIDFGTFKLQWTYPAADGAVSITFSFGEALAHFTENLFRWIWEEGGCDEATRDTPWIELSQGLFSGTVAPSEADRLCAVIARFTATRTRAYLASEAARRRVMLAPICDTAEVMQNDHLAARRFWDVVQQPGADRSHRHPGRFVVAHAAPLRDLGPAPRLGHHDADVAPVRADRTVDLRPADADVGSALAGVRVLDLTWSVAGPYIGRLLADFGATVVRIESRSHPDLARTTSPFHPDGDGLPLEASGLYANCNAGKLGIELDLSDPSSREVFWDLVSWADALVESFSAGALARMGFGYEQLHAVNPRLVVLSSCLQGQSGPLAMPGLGNLTSALFGFTSTTGWPGRPPCGPFGAYTDVVSPRFGIAALLAALEHRERTGEGQYLDLSQAECSMHLQATALLDAEVNGRPFAARGNRDLVMAPHGVYPAAGNDTWVAIACATDVHWRSLAAWLDLPDLAGLSETERHERHDDLDELIARRTASRDADALQNELQNLGIPAHQVQNSPECLADPQLAHRGHYVTVAHPLLGPVLVEGPRFRLSRTPGHVRGAGPIYGQHADDVREMRRRHDAVPTDAS
jgi:crotonobetainyl-CoA:carnitine CoA-transferase CaiB-like acyl-CoA transferase